MWRRKHRVPLTGELAYLVKGMIEGFLSENPNLNYPIGKIKELSEDKDGLQVVVEFYNPAIKDALQQRFHI